MSSNLNEHWQTAPANARWATQDNAGVCIYWADRDPPYYSGYQWNGAQRIDHFTNGSLMGHARQPRPSK